MDLTEFKKMVAGHTQVTVTSYPHTTPPHVLHKTVDGIDEQGIRTTVRFPWMAPCRSRIEWPRKCSPLGYEINGTSLTWTTHGKADFTYAFPLTVEQALAAAYDEAGRPRARIE